MNSSLPHRLLRTRQPLRLTLALCLLCFVYVISVRAQGDDDSVIAAPPAPAQDTKEQAKASARSVVRGRVVYEDNNRPVRRASVMLLRVDGQGVREKKGVTDERGEFSITEVSAGSYVVAIDSPGIITPFSYADMEEKLDEKSALAQMRAEFDPITVNGTNNVEVQVKARRGGVISGRVTYSDGDLATNAQVILLRKKDGRFVRFLLSINPTAFISLRTDDRGMYRVAGLPPGEYVVGATEINTRADKDDDGFAFLRGMFGSDALNTSYYQNQTSLRAATVLKVEAGQEVNGVDVTFIERPMYTVSGTVVTRQGRMPVPARLSIQPKSGNLSLIPFLESGPTAQADEHGRWTFPDVPDGTYVITVEPSAIGMDETDAAPPDSEESQRNPQPPRIARRLQLVRRQQEFTVSGGDLSNVVIELSEGGRIQGTVVVEGGKFPPQTAFLLSTPNGNPLMDKYGSVRSDGGFTIDAIPAGEFSLRLVEPSGKYYIKAMTAGSTDLLRDTLKIGSGANIQNVRVTLASDTAQLTGRVVSSEDRKPARGMGVMLVPADPARWRFVASYLFDLTDTDGAFSITAAPGSYLIMTLTPVERASVNEAFVRARSASARQVSLQPNGRETIELLAPAAGPR